MSTDDSAALARRAQQRNRERNIFRRLTRNDYAVIRDVAPLIDRVKFRYKKILHALGGPGAVNRHQVARLQSRLNEALGRLESGLALFGMDFTTIDPGRIPYADYHAANHFIRRRALRDRVRYWGTLLHRAEHAPH